MDTVFDSSEELSTMRRRYTMDFSQLFNMGYQNYSQGEWQSARRFLENTRYMLRSEDGPSAALLRFMKTSNFQAPDSWRGVRELYLRRVKKDNFAASEFSNR